MLVKYQAPGSFNSFFYSFVSVLSDGRVASEHLYGEKQGRTRRKHNI